MLHLKSSRLSSYLFPRITSNVVFGLLSLNARVQPVIDDFFVPEPM